MPALCFPPSGADTEAGGFEARGSADNRVPRPANNPNPGDYTGLFDTMTAEQLAQEAASGNGAALFAQRGDGRGCNLLCLGLIAAGLWYLSRN